MSRLTREQVRIAVTSQSEGGLPWWVNVDHVDVDIAADDRRAAKFLQYHAADIYAAIHNFKRANFSTENLLIYLPAEHFGNASGMFMGLEVRSSWLVSTIMLAVELPLKAVPE